MCANYHTECELSSAPVSTVYIHLRVVATVALPFRRRYHQEGGCPPRFARGLCVRATAPRVKAPLWTLARRADGAALDWLFGRGGPITALSGAISGAGERDAFGAAGAFAPHQRMLLLLASLSHSLPLSTPPAPSLFSGPIEGYLYSKCRTPRYRLAAINIRSFFFSFFTPEVVYFIILRFEQISALIDLFLFLFQKIVFYTTSFRLVIELMKEMNIFSILYFHRNVNYVDFKRLISRSMAVSS